MPVDYLQKILTAKVYDVAIESALDLAPTLSQRIGNRVLLKREDQQPVFSFKLRGAYNKMAHLSAAERNRGVVTASAGNHGQGVALAAQKLGCKATIVMPVTTPSIKIQAVAARGAKVVLHGDFHHYNVLSAQRANWLAIDPKGMLGDPGYEVGPFLCNPWLSPPAVLQQQARRGSTRDEGLPRSIAGLTAD